MVHTFPVFHRVALWAKSIDDHCVYIGNYDFARNAECIQGNLVPQRNRILTGWKEPWLGSLRWNIDSALGKPGRAGIGGVLRNQDEQFLSIFSCLVEIKDSNEAEVIAVRKAMEISAPSTLAQEVHWIF